MNQKKEAAQYYFNAEGDFVIENYQQAKPFSNFFPGVAGVWGTPMWAFYVNRGQAISSFGIESKDKAILEFLPANKAYRMTSLQGFRTFLKVRSGTREIFWEPFVQNSSATKMTVRSHELILEDELPRVGIGIRVTYFTLPGEPFAGLVRSVELFNRSRKPVFLEVVDGLPLILPYGMRDWTVKNMSRTVEAWVKVRNVAAKAPFYQLNVEVADTPDVKYIKEGNFYFSYVTDGKKTKLLDPIVEAGAVFGQATDFVSPQVFLAGKSFVIPKRQETASRTPSAMCYAKFALNANSGTRIVSVIGQTYAVDHLNLIVKSVVTPGYIEKKRNENRALIAGIKDYAATASASSAFDAYCGQTFLDNVLRGGLPVTVKTSEGPVAFNVFSRKHGDPERDYNYFVLSPTYFSQGNGNFRDVNQNRRNDVWFNPDVKDASVIDFWNLIQADGFNPLIVKGMTFSFVDPERLEIFLAESVKGECEPLRALLQKSFSPGEVFKCVFENNLHLRETPEKFLESLLSHCHRAITADHGEGFWSDHWTYNLDLVESYLGVYPEYARSLLLEKRAFTYYHNSHYLAPRTGRYVLTPKGVRQYHAVIDGSKEIRANETGNRLRVKNGQGEVYHTNLLAKMICLIANKTASFDPSGVGLEMEGDKPNWYDSLNGLPGLLGSSLSETLELKRLAGFVLNHIDGLHFSGGELTLFVELHDLIRELSAAFSSEKDPQAVWHKVNDAKEHYRKRILHGIDGAEIVVDAKEIRGFLKEVIERCRRALEAAKRPDGLLSTYFYHEVTDFAPLDKTRDGQGMVLPVSFARHDLPLFLEGFVHALKADPDPKSCAELFRGVRGSDLFDRKLKMYKVNAELTSETEEIGRTRIFPRGWLENESVWLHMQYKYLLEILRSGLHDEFFAAMKDVLVPFLKPEVYGRSTLENSSFIASSVHEDKNFHGQGFVARLSGSTAEFMHMWLIMSAGLRPFRWDNKKGLELQLAPILPGWMFSRSARDIFLTTVSGESHKVRLPKDSYAFRFLGSTLVVYHNPSRKNTFGSGAAVIARIRVTDRKTGKTEELQGSVIPDRLAEDIREGGIERIDLELI